MAFGFDSKPIHDFSKHAEGNECCENIEDLVNHTRANKLQTLEAMIGRYARFTFLRPLKVETHDNMIAASGTIDSIAKHDLNGFEVVLKSASLEPVMRGGDVIEQVEFKFTDDKIATIC